jgi:hypothetical protein
MKQIITQITFFVLFANVAFGQYSETFDVPNKGILEGPCTSNDPSTCTSFDFAGVNWTLEGNLSGLTAADDNYFTEGGVLRAMDIDEEICWLSPVLNITGIASFSLDLTWLAFDDYVNGTPGSQDYIDVSYRIDGGSWVTLSNAVGGGPRTISYGNTPPASNVNGSISGLGASGLTGSTLQIRVCVDVNSAAEIVTIDNVAAVNATTGTSGPTCDLVLGSVDKTDEDCPGANDGSITVNATTSNGPITYTLGGPVNASNQTGIFANLPPGNYEVALQDGSFTTGTCTENTGNINIAAGVDNTPPTGTAPGPVIVDCPADIPAPDPNLVTNVNDNCMIPCATEPWINEFHYDNIGADVNEFIEVAGPAGIDLSIYTLYVYDGFNGEFYNTFNLSGIIPDEDNGFGAEFVLTPNLQNTTEGIALVKNGNQVIEFISYEGVLTATNGPANGMTSVDVGVAESNDFTATNGSLGRIGNGNKPGDFTWTVLTQTQGTLNTGQSITDCPDNEPTVAHFSDVNNGGAASAGNPYIVTRTYRITDAAGNTTDVTQTLTANNCCPTYSNNIAYVNANATGANNGTSWSDAFNDLQDALNSTCPGIAEIWVAAGTYYPTSGADRSISFVMKNGVAIYGGFNGNETLLSERDWLTNETILSGDIGVSGDNSDNSYHVIFNSFNFLNTSAVLDGFFIKDGNAIGPNFPYTHGGGMHNNFASPLIINCIFNGNQALAGGGIYNQSSHPEIKNCSFLENTSQNVGGGIFNTNGSSPVISSSVFKGNTAADEGGGIFSGFGGDATPALTNCTFLQNSANRGGAMFNSVSADAIVINCTFSNNSTGIANASFTTQVTLVNCILWENNTEITNENGSSITISHSIVQGGYAGTGNLNTNPLFVDADNGDLRLQPCSPAINAGDNAAVPAGIITDLDGNPRFYNSGTVDMGAFEYQGVKNVNPTNGGEIAANQTVCFGDIPDPFTSVSPASGYVGDLEYQWQISIVSPTLVDILGAVSETYTHVGTVTQTTWFRRLAKVTCESVWVESNVVEVTVNPTRRYVTETGAGLMDGSSWANAHSGSQLQAAINAQCVTEVWVAEGTYQPSLNSSFIMKEGVAILGGFPNTGNPGLTERNYAANTTILEGNGTRVINNSDNGLTHAAVLDGFTVTGGVAAGSNGGGAFNRNVSPTFRNCIFKDNAGYGDGAMHLQNGSAIVTNCVFIGNTAELYTGAIRVSWNGITTSPVITNCSFSGNTGPGIYCGFNTTAVIRNCVIWGNNDGIYLLQNANPTVTNSIVQGGIAGTGNIDTDPLFVSQPSIGLGTGGDLRLQACSPAINTGNNASVPGGINTDLDGNPRFYNSGIVDMGAYEYQGEKHINPTNGGEIAADQTLCSGFTPDPFTSVSPASGFVGDLEYQWQISTPSPTFVDIPGATTDTYTHTGTITQTTWFRRLAKIDCETMWIESNVVHVSVDPLPIATAGGTTTICVNSLHQVSGVSAANGTILWLHNGAGSLSDETTLTPTYSTASADGGNTVTLTLTVTSDNTCSPATATAVYTISVDPLPVGGTATKTQTICSGATPDDLELTGQTGNVLKWQHSLDAAFTSPTDISVTSATLAGSSIGALTQTTWFRAEVQSGVCSPAFSAAVVVNVDALTVAGTATNTQTFCNGETPDDLQLIGYTGNVLKWQSAADAAFSSPSDIAETSTTLAGSKIGALTATTWFRAEVQSGVCSPAFSTSVAVHVPTKFLVTDPDGNPVSSPKLQNIPFDIRVTLVDANDNPVALPGSWSPATINLGAAGSAIPGELKRQGFLSDPVTAILNQGESSVLVENVLYSGLSFDGTDDLPVTITANMDVCSPDISGISNPFFVRGIVFLVVADPIEILADNISTSNITVTLTNAEDTPAPVSNTLITVSTTLGGFTVDPSKPATVTATTDLNGQVQLSLQSGLVHGPVTVTALCPGACPATATLIFTQARIINQTQQTGFDLISDAVGAANTGDILFISESIYDESVNTSGKSLTLVPGNSAGTITITGSLTLGSGDVLEIEIFDANDFDKFIVNGAVNLDDALLKLSIPDNYEPTPGAIFQIIDYGSLEGEFSNKSFVATTNDKSFVIDYNGNNGTAVVLTNVRRLFKLEINTAGP